MSVFGPAPAQALWPIWERKAVICTKIAKRPLWAFRSQEQKSLMPQDPPKQVGSFAPEATSNSLTTLTDVTVNDV
jgi:hypothetical protein